jgi:hypothetical protein
MLDERELATYAAGLAAALRVIGPTPRDRALEMLGRLRLGEADAAVVIAHGVLHGLLIEDGGLVQSR